MRKTMLWGAFLTIGLVAGCGGELSASDDEFMEATANQGTLTATPNPAAAGAQITVSGSDIRQSRYISYLMLDRQQLLGGIAFDGNGNFSTAANIPLSTAPGAHLLWVKQWTSRSQTRMVASTELIVQ